MQVSWFKPEFEPNPYKRRLQRDDLIEMVVLTPKASGFELYATPHTVNFLFHFLSCILKNDPKSRTMTLYLHYGSVMMKYRSIPRHLDLPDFLNIYTKVNNGFNLLRDDTELDDACVQTLTKDKELNVYLDYDIDGMGKEDIVNEEQDDNECGDEAGVKKGKDDVGVEKGQDNDACVDKECQWRVHAHKVKDKLPFRTDVIEEVQVHISNDQADRAKRRALKVLEGNPDEQFALLWDYAQEIKRTNPGSTVIIGTNQSTGLNLFDRFYVCLNALKHGILGLNIENDSDYAFMYDKQKGLIITFYQVFPNSNHRFFVSHLHSNFKFAGSRGLALKEALWKAAMATTPNEFSMKMDEMRALNVEATA
ncbi:hypothetical protein BUALT_Bualt12G0106700 [Buddleja alternifolia]|uniref:Transposase n=1 Tax=Buddleja alternifolia TaxID=168488 RepID=A0AAV6WRU1_9LAMI|nr:hypothetical protein BUALT_Bualt12G0106700 [Buddleja alternifolia]